VQDLNRRSNPNRDIPRERLYDELRNAENNNYTGSCVQHDLHGNKRDLGQDDGYFYWEKPTSVSMTASAVQGEGFLPAPEIPTAVNVAIATGVIAAVSGNPIANPVPPVTGNHQPEPQGAGDEVNVANAAATNDVQMAPMAVPPLPVSQLATVVVVEEEEEEEEEVGISNGRSSSSSNSSSSSSRTSGRLRKRRRFHDDDNL
jgi:hypothetical protein